MLTCVCLLRSNTELIFHLDHHNRFFISSSQIFNAILLVAQTCFISVVTVTLISSGKSVSSSKMCNSHVQNLKLKWEAQRLREDQAVKLFANDLNVSNRHLYSYSDIFIIFHIHVDPYNPLQVVS